MDENMKYRQEEDGGDAALKTVALSALIKLHHVPRKPPTDEQVKSIRGSRDERHTGAGRLIAR